MNDSADPVNEWLGTPAVARLAGVHPNTITRLRLNGRMPEPTWIGSHPKWTRAEIEAWIASNRGREQPTGPSPPVPRPGGPARCQRLER